MTQTPSENNEKGTETARDEAAALIPWFVNGTLSSEEAAKVQALIDSDPSFVEEVDFYKTVASSFSEELEVQTADNHGFEKLRNLIESHEPPMAERASAPKLDKSGWFFGLFRDIRFAGPGIAVAATVVLFVSFGGESTPGATFETLTSEQGDIEGPTIRFQAQSGATVEDLQALLAPLGVVEVRGPSTSGVFTAILNADADATELAEDVMALDEILFAAPGVEN